MARGRKRTKPLDAATMETVTCRLPTVMIAQLDAEAVRIAKDTGLTAVNRSDVMRSLLERALRQS